MPAQCCADMRHRLPTAAAAVASAQVAKLPRWQQTLTIRALVIGAILGACFSIISLKLGLTTGGEWGWAGCAGLEPCCRPRQRPEPAAVDLLLLPSCTALRPPAVIPSLNIAAGLLGFFFLKSLAKG